RNYAGRGGHAHGSVARVSGRTRAGWTVASIADGRVTDHGRWRVDGGRDAATGSLVAVVVVAAAAVVEVIAAAVVAVVVAGWTLRACGLAGRVVRFVYPGGVRV